MEDICFFCQDYKSNIGHDSKTCPFSECKKCGKNGHFQMNCNEKELNLSVKHEISEKIEKSEELLSCQICSTNEEGSEDEFYNHLIMFHFKEKLLMR